MSGRRKGEENERARARGASIPGVGSPAATGQDTLEFERLLLESVRDYAIFSLDPSGYVLSWNQGAQRIKGYAPEEIIGRHFSAFYPPEEVARGRHERLLALAAREGRAEDEGWRIRKDGTRFWANVVLTALRDPQGELLGYAKITRDLTERRKAEQAIRASEERFRLLVQSVKDYAIFMLDPRGRIVSWNIGAERLKGYREGEVLGRHFSLFYPEADRWKPSYELQVATQDGSYEEEGWRLRKDGSRFWANVVITAVRDETGRLIGFAKVTRDLTERRKAEERRLADARKVAEAEASNRAKMDFLAAMSHELRTPLNAIGGYVDLLLHGVRGPLTTEQTGDLERVRRGQQHLLHLLNELLNFSRIEAGHLDYRIEAVPLGEVVAEAAILFAPEAEARSISFEADELQPVTACTDRAKVVQILINLLSNAVKFTDPGGSVRLTCTREGDGAILRVADTGLGVPPDHLDAIFDPFVQAGRSLTSRHEGTGLGLAIRRDLAEAMDGTLTVESEVGAGSVFTLRLPLDGG